jgi:CheY-like chemotaxis protein
MSVLVLVVDDEPDVEALFRQQFRHDLRAQRFIMDFAVSAADALTRIAAPSSRPWYWSSRTSICPA